MDFRHLRAFVVVAEELHFTKAAERLHISQPPLSRLIRQLEQESGVTLFDRTKSRVVLTAAGHRLLRRARALVASGEDFLRIARSLGDEGTGVVKIGMSIGFWEIVNRVRALHARRFPYIAIEATDLMSHEQAHALIRRHIDVGFSRDPASCSRLRSERLFDERLVVLLRSGHPLARRRTLRLQDLAGETLLLHERSRAPVAYDRTLGLYAAAQIAPKVMTTSAFAFEQPALLLVASGRGITVAPEKTLGSAFTGLDRTQGVAMVPLSEPRASIPVSMIWRADEKSSAVLEFLQSARNAMRAGSPRRDKTPELTGTTAAEESLAGAGHPF